MENNIKFLRSSRGLSQKEVASAMRVTVAQVSKWESGSVDIPSSRILALADLLRCPVGELIGMPRADMMSIDMNPGYRMQESTAIGTISDIPVYLGSIGPEKESGDKNLEKTVFDPKKAFRNVRRPVALTGRDTIYGLYVAGSSMEPRFMDGEMILADPEGRVRNGDDVVVHLIAEIDEADRLSSSVVLIKRLARRTATYLELDQHCPPMTVKLDIAEVAAVDRVVPLYEVLG